MAENKAVGGAVGGLVDALAGFAQSAMDASVKHAAREEYRARWKSQVMEVFNDPSRIDDNMCRVGGVTGVLLVIGVAEPRAINLVPVPTYREFLGIHVAGYGNDPAEVKARYLQQPSMVALSANTHLHRVDYYVWMNRVEAMTW
ncbi:hypothetical protein [Vannielia sp.]|uniref:hypothetical protein n=1 Tax=Vannielia sp. TaxID=2813045 RepID=UPI00263071DA|nr:hypothetical protein [Vannielia sp.]MDF1871281.1 hypothetical protein [Vannielia sp.]